MKNKLYFADNLYILRQMENESVDLICTDPPSNSGHRNNDFLITSLTHNIGFTDSWTWDKAAEDTRADIDIKAAKNKTYKALNECLRAYDIMLRNAVSGVNGAVRTYLAFMGPRLVEMHRVLSNTGSIYLHTDPNACHYLKCLMDAIFGKENFKNEIVWQFRRPAPASNQFHKMHEIILFYTKSNDYVFTKSSPVHKSEHFIQDAVTDFTDGKPHHLKDSNGKSIKRRISRDDISTHDVWDDIKHTASTSIERLGYPTQRPRLLYERMIQASSKEGNVVLDPFCGGGTTLDAAHAHKRHWIGIDKTILAMDPIETRLKDRYGLKPSKDYETIGYPTDTQDVRKLAQDKTMQDELAYWAVTRLELTPTKKDNETKQTTIWTSKDSKKSDLRVLAEFKVENTNPGLVRKLQKSMEDNNVPLGILVTLEPATADMQKIADAMGKYDYRGLTYPRLQFWQITDGFFKNPEIGKTLPQLPGLWHLRSKKKTRHPIPIPSPKTDAFS